MVTYCSDSSDEGSFTTDEDEYVGLYNDSFLHLSHQLDTDRDVEEPRAPFTQRNKSRSREESTSRCVTNLPSTVGAC